MKRYNLILVTAAFVIAAVGAIAGQQNDNALTTIYGRNTSGSCLPGDPSTMQIGCSTAAASFPCSIIIYSTNEQGRAYNTKVGSTCAQALWYN